MDIKAKIKVYLKEEILSEETVNELSDKSSLLESGLIDSITTLQLVDYLEQEFKIEFQAHEVDRDNLDTLEMMEVFIKSKLE